MIPGTDHVAGGGGGAAMRGSGPMSWTSAIEPSPATRTDPDRLRLSLFDGWRLEVAGRLAVMPVMAQRLIAYLALHGTTTRPHVAGTLWPAVDEERAAGNLRSTMWRIRKHRQHLISDHGGVLALCPEAEVDVTEFTTQARDIVIGRVNGDLATLLPHHRGELLPGWYEDWVVFERERLRQLRLHALDVAALSLAQRRRYAEALDLALTAVTSDPLRESAHRTVILIHLAEGNVHEAVRSYLAYSRLLEDELGVRPGADLHDLLTEAGVELPC